jgi:acyl dehydratase
MPVRSAIVGAAAPPHHATCDARWLMAYSAGLGIADPAYLDTTRPAGVLAHPLFPVAVEWALLTTSRSAIDYGLSRAESLRGVHAGHHLTIHRPIRQGDEVDVIATVAGVETTPPGARVTVRLEAVDAANNQPIWTTWYVTVYRGVAVDGADIAPSGKPEPLPPSAPNADVEHRTISIPATAAHVYTECARIWNPIHTDLSVARAAGLPGIILHGTATLAHGVTGILEMIGAAADAVRTVSGSFRAMVPVPATLTVELLGATDVVDARGAHFQVRTKDDRIAVRDGYLKVARE